MILTPARTRSEAASWDMPAPVSFTMIGTELLAAEPIASKTLHGVLISFRLNALLQKIQVNCNCIRIYHLCQAFQDLRARSLQLHGSDVANNRNLWRCISDG